MNDKVYIIVPIYNSEAYLKRCLDSIFNQTFKNFEVICVNDGSTDSSLDILNSYAKKYPNLNLINKANGGLSSARNAGLDYIKCKDQGYLLFIDSDDYISVDYIERLIDIQNATKSDIVCSAYFIDRTNGDIAKSKNQLKNERINSYNALLLLFSGKLQSHAQTKLFKCKIWENIRFDENICFMEDQAIMFKIFLKSNLIALTDYCGYYFVMSEGSLCRSKMTNKKILSALVGYLAACKHNYDIFLEEEQKYLKNAADNLFCKIYLMMYGRFSKRNSNYQEKREWKNIVDYVNKNKLIKKFKPKTNIEKIERFVYIYSRVLYKTLFLMTGRH